MSIKKKEEKKPCVWQAEQDPKADSKTGLK